jgi:hypothetical protein
VEPTGSGHVGWRMGWVRCCLRPADDEAGVEVEGEVEVRVGDELNTALTLIAQRIILPFHKLVVLKVVYC